MSDPVQWGRDCASQDACENCPFATVGGLAARADMQAPDFVPEGEREEFLRGYREQARAMYGENWQTCEFGWYPALIIPGSNDDDHA